MQVIGGRVVYSATDLVGFLECRHLADLERAVAEGHLQRPVRKDAVLDRIIERGRQHEARFLETLQAEGLAVVDLTSDDALPREERLARARDATVEAMRSGVEVIYQAALFDGRRLGYADFLRRVERPSNLGAWSYEVWDTKLARHAKASAVLQLCMYSDMVAAIQGLAPEWMHLALGGIERETVPLRVSDYAAYYRMVAADLEAAMASAPAFPVTSKPEPVEHCGVCRWTVECRARWRADDDLSLVAGLTSRQRRALQRAGVETRRGLATAGAALPDRIEGAGREALARIRAQAAIQVQGDDQTTMISERIAPPRDREGALVPGQGLLMLPAPSRGDLFFDIEGDPFFSSTDADGIDYLFGVIEPGLADASGGPTFHAFWAIEGGTVTAAAERRAFEAFIDLVMERLEADPELHVYHYAPYEPTAVKRLAGRYGTREAEVDALLRGGVFVDLYRAVRQGIRASVESYSIKKLEPLYGFRREIDLRDAGTSIVEFETWLELGNGGQRTELLEEIEGYNRDDCVSTWRLRDWLEGERAALETDLGEALPRPAFVDAPEREDSEAQRAVQALADALLDGLSDHLEAHDRDEHGRWLLAQLLSWHRREAKSFWWRYFYLRDELSDEERREEPDALGELEYETSFPDPTPGARSTIYRFRFPPQEHRFRVGDGVEDPATRSSAGSIFSIDGDAGVVELKRGRTQPVPTPRSLIGCNFIRPDPKPASLQRLATWVLEAGVDAPGEFRAARDLLLRLPPRIAGHTSGAALLGAGEDVQAAARRLVVALDESYLAVQGPPGSGKSTVGAEMILDLVAAGRRVGVTANSHKVIGELLDKVAKLADDRKVAVNIGQRIDADAASPLVTAVSNDEARDGLAERRLDVVGGTAWLWAREDMTAAVDVLFVDEAGQMSLADALAAASGARNLVLLGDPQQLDQPLQGTHPPGADRSALAHLLDGAQVMPGELGLFLDGSWRLHPKITAFTSELFYDGRLHSHPGREVMRVTGAGALDGAGVRFVVAEHEGCSSESPEEAAAVAELVRDLLASKPMWVPADDRRAGRQGGEERPFTSADVLLITPYNAQVAALRAELPGLHIGTVDKFQGQEAPIAIYSMATSSADEAPRGLEFLYSLNRLNVATSRAQGLAVVVASPGLLRVRCRTPRQMRLVNALVRFVELAQAE